MVRNVKNRSLKTRLIAAIRGQQALQARNGKVNAYIALTTIYKILKAETNAEKAQIRGILNRDFIQGKKEFDRCPAAEGKKRSGSYRLHVEAAIMEGTVESNISSSESVEVTDGLTA